MLSLAPASSADLWLPRSLAHVGTRSKGGRVNLGQSTGANLLPSPQQEQQRERLAEGGYFGSVSLATAATGRLWRFFYRC